MGVFSLDANRVWYNLEDRENYTFASYLVIRETNDDKEFCLIEEKNEADMIKLKSENDKRYVYVSQVLKVNGKTHNLIMGVF